MKDIQSAKNIDKEGRVLYLDQELLGRKARFYKKGIKLYPDMERQTGTIIMPLDVDLTNAAEKTVVPLDMIKESLKSVGYIAGMDRCLCRDANDCADYPHDLGCLFLAGSKLVLYRDSSVRSPSASASGSSFCAWRSAGAGSLSSLDWVL